MSPIVILVLSLIVAGIAASGAHAWFERVERRRRELSVGIEVLAARNWRDALDLVARALTGSAGAVVDASRPQSERLLPAGRRGRLLVYKHGTAYALAPSALIEAQRRQLEVEAEGLCVATLGTFTEQARAQAERDGIELLDGPTVWARVRPLLEERITAEVAREAAQAVRTPRLIAVGGTAALGLLVAALQVPSLLEGWSAAAEASTARGAPRAAPAVEAAGVAPVATASSDPATQAARRAALAAAMIDLRTVEGASWASSSTIVVELRPGADTEVAAVEACGLAELYPELHDVRLQFQSGQPGDAVRWRRCS